MATIRKVKCKITGEVGTNETFVKIGNYYYKSQYVYDEYHREKEERKQLIDYVCRTFLGYSEGQPFPTVLTKKLNELSFYDNAVILETFKLCEKEILYWLDRKDFSGDYGKVSYIFAIINNKIADVNRSYIKKEAAQNKEPRDIDFIDYDNPNLSSTSKSGGNSLLGFLEGDEL